MYLAQEDLAAQLGVSRQPVSHALMLLRHDGLVVERGRKGQMVAPIDPENLLSLYQARGALDALAARLTASRDKPMRESFRAKFEAVLAEGDQAMADQDIDRLIVADVDFHQSIYAFSGNPKIAIMAEAAWHHVLRAMRTVLADADRRQRARAEHHEIVAAILAGDSVTAAERATYHAEAAGEATFQRLTKAA